jgi:hypothetical protein
MKQNIIMGLAKWLIQQACVVVAKLESSISRMLTEERQVFVFNTERFEPLRVKAYADLEQGLDLGAFPIRRDKLRER